MRKVLFLYCIILGVIPGLISCSSRSAIRVVKEDRNIILGRVLYSDSTAATTSIISLFDVQITSRGDTIRSSSSVPSVNNGFFILSNAPDGNYILYTYDTLRGLSDISQIKKNQGTLQLPGPIILKPLITLRGRVVGEGAGVQVIIPGLGASAITNDNGDYELLDVPAGNYDIVFLKQDSVNYLNVSIAAVQPGIVYIKDICLRFVKSSVSYPHTFFPTSAKVNFSILPLESISGNHNSSAFVSYFLHDGASKN